MTGGQQTIKPDDQDDVMGYDWRDEWKDTLVAVATGVAAATGAVVVIFSGGATSGGGAAGAAASVGYRIHQN